MGGLCIYREMYTNFFLYFAAMTGNTGTIMTDMLKTEVTETLLTSSREKNIASRRRRKQMAGRDLVY